mgnify:CR=1 FL=1
MADKVTVGKTYAERMAEVNKLFGSIDASNIGTIPADVVALVNTLDGLNVRDLLCDDEGKALEALQVESRKVRQIVTKKGNTLYEVYSSGFGLTPLRKAGKHTLEVKVSLLLR